MKLKNLKPLLILLFVLLFNITILGTGCEKEDELPPKHAKGEIIAISAECYGEIVIIEVDKPQRIGVSGSFDIVGVSYNNAIGIPYFSKIGISDSIPQTVGTHLYFKYRELTEEERLESSLFTSTPPPECNGLIAPPSLNYLIITEIISYK